MAQNRLLHIGIMSFKSLLEKLIFIVEESDVRRSGRARSSTPVHGQPGSCSLWSLVCIEYETESEASEGRVELQPRSDHICQF